MPARAPRPSILSLRKTLPPILNLPPTSTGNNVPKSLHKTRRTWLTNTHRIDQPLVLLSSAHKDKYGRHVLKGLKMRARDVRSFDKAGGVEGALLSQSPSNLTPFGTHLRTTLFERLHQVRSSSGSGLGASTTTTTTTTSGGGKLTGVEGAMERMGLGGKGFSLGLGR